MRHEYSINPILKILVSIWMFFFKRRYRVTANISDEIANLNEPYLLIANHCGRYDPFIISYFIKKRPHFISSDAILRDKVIGTLFKGLGAMPKKKGVRDSVIIREMAKVVNRGGALALFPEGARTWDGETLYLDPSLVKLVRLLKIPVITAKMKGCYSFDPRWAKGLRQAAMEIDYKLILKSDEIKTTPEDEIMRLINENIHHDEVPYQREKMVKIDSDRRAEFLDLVLFQCPSCKSFEGYDSKENNITCKHCESTVFVDEYGFLQNEKEALPFDNIKDWMHWQNRNFVNHVSEQFDNKVQDPLFFADNMQIEFAIGTAPMQPLGVGKVSFFIDHLKVEFENSVISLSLKDVSTLGPQYKERLEIFHEDDAYRFTCLGTREPGIKWELAANLVWARTDELFKISPYNKALITSVVGESPTA